MCNNSVIHIQPSSQTHLWWDCRSISITPGYCSLPWPLHTTLRLWLEGAGAEAFSFKKPDLLQNNHLLVLKHFGVTFSGWKMEIISPVFLPFQAKSGCPNDPRLNVWPSRWLSNNTTVMVSVEQDYKLWKCAMNIPPWQQKIFSSTMAATGKQLKQSVKVFHSFILYRLLPVGVNHNYMVNLIWKPMKSQLLSLLHIRENILCNSGSE